MMESATAAGRAQVCFYLYLFFFVPYVVCWLRLFVVVRFLLVRGLEGRDFCICLVRRYNFAFLCRQLMVLLYFGISHYLVQEISQEFKSISSFASYCRCRVRVMGGRGKIVFAVEF